MTTRKESFLSFLQDYPTSGFTAKEAAEMLGVNTSSFATDAFKWVNSPEFSHVHRAGSGNAGDPYKYWFDSEKERGMDLVRKHRRPRSNKRTKVTPKATQAKPQPVVEASTRTLIVAPGQENGTFAQIIFEDGTDVILIDDKSRLIRGRVLG